MSGWHGNIYTTICKIDSQWEFAIWLRELRLGLFDNLQGLDGVGGGKDAQEGEEYIYLWLIHVDVSQKPTQYYKAIILQF